MNIQIVLYTIEKDNFNGLTKKNLLVRLSNALKVKQNEIEGYVKELEELGELFFANKKYFTRKHLGYKTGKISGNAKGYAFCALDELDQDDVFIAKRNLNGALHGDRVVIDVKKNNYDGRNEGKVVKIVEHGIKNVVGTIQVFEKFAFVVPDNKKINCDVFVPKSKINKAKDGSKVYVKIVSYKGKNMSGEVTEILGENAGEIDTDVLSIIRSYDLIENFSDELLNQVKSVPQLVDVKNYPDHKDLRNLILFTIDGDDSKDFDDAVSLEMENGIYNLGVHIADVGEYVKMGSLLDKEAYNRGTSVYFPNTVLPMLPKELSNGICSLNPKQDRLALSVFMKINNEGKVISHEILQSVINSNERMTYNKVTKILEGDLELRKEYSQIVPILENMQKLALILEKVRKDRGSIDFDIPEPKIILNPTTLEVESLSERPRTISERLIESFMLLANETVAEHYKKLNIPFVYRVHEAPEKEKLENFNSFVAGIGMSLNIAGNKVQPKEIQNFMNKVENTDFKDVVNTVLLRSMQKAKYSPVNLGHFGLAAEYYCHFTSPIRRYPDLTIHRIIKMQLKNQLNAGKIAKLKEFVVSSSNQSSERELLAQRAERDVDDYFKARFMLNKIGEEFDGVVSGVTQYGIFVELENTVEGYINLMDLPGDNYQFDDKKYSLYNNNYNFALGKRVRVKVLNVNLQEREIDFSLAQNEENK